MRCTRIVLAIFVIFALAGCSGIPFFGGGSKGVPMQPKPAPVTPQTSGPQSACLVLALPAGGPIGPVADKIRAGATVAQQESSKSGVKIDIRHINTEQADWLTQLSALPPQCAVVGGPMRVPIFTALTTTGTALAQRHFFAFLPEIGDMEGRGAWRFFPSRQDQVAALLRFTRTDLDITSYAAFYPADAYSTRITGIFEQAVKAAGGTVQGASYNPAAMQDWPKTAESLFKPRLVQKVPIPSTNFGAVFVPDLWKNMDMIIASLLVSGEDRLVLMGTSLWEQGITPTTMVNANNYALAVFPGAWDPGKIPAVLAALPVKDFWVGLGYDFVRFGSMLGMQGVETADAVNARIQRAQSMPWAMAPIQWSAQGVASQQLFLFTPTQTAQSGQAAQTGQASFALLNVPAFKERRAQIVARFESRSKAAATGQPVPPLLNPASLPGAAPALSPVVVPRPSRAPSLPGT